MLIAVRKRVTKQMQMEKQRSSSQPRLFSAIVVPMSAGKSKRSLGKCLQSLNNTKAYNTPSERKAGNMPSFASTFLPAPAPDDHTYLLAPRRSSNEVTLITTSPVLEGRYDFLHRPKSGLLYHDMSGAVTSCDRSR
jgi:hypothetical protein